MGLAESTLKAQSVKNIVRPDSITPLPSFAVDSCKFVDGSFGFLLTTVDLAKNMNSYGFQLKELFSPSENTLVYVGKDESTITFVKDRLSGKVYCTVCKFGSGSSIVRQCVTTYEPIDNQAIDKIAEFYLTK
jgi:hypothetical protein